jgi:hypothetical protein
MVKMKNYNGISNDLQNTTQESEYWATGNPQKAGSSCPTSGTRRFTFIANQVINE